MSRPRIALAVFIVVLISVPAAFSQTDSKIPRRLRATVSSIEGTAITFFDGAISIDAAQASVRDGDRVISLDSIRPGMQLVVLLGETDASDSPHLSATMVSIERGPTGRLSGPVDWVDSPGRTFGLLGRTINASSRTRFIHSDRGDEPGRFDDLVRGVEIDADVTASGSVLEAQDVTIREQADRTAAAIRGIVKSITGPMWVITTGDGTAKQVTVTAETTIVGTPEVGSRVEVFGYVENDRFIAVAILKARVRAVSNPVRIFAGTVSAIGAESWTIRLRDEEIVVGVNSATAITGDPHVGDWVEVAAERASDGKLVARKIHKIAAPALVTDKVLIHGVVKTIGVDSWTITNLRGADVVLSVRPDTRIVGDPHVGDTVEALARRDGEALIALAIFKVPSPPPPTDLTRLRGTVKAIGSALWTITTRDGDVDIVVNAATKVSDGIQTGDEVEVLASRTGEGKLLALAILEIVEPPPPPPPPTDLISIHGIVKTITTTRWTITTRGGDVDLIVNAETKIGGAPKAGDEVEVLATRTPEGLRAVAIYTIELPPLPPPSFASFNGKVKTIGVSEWTITMRDATDILVLVTSTTKIVGDPKVGDNVEVLGQRKETGTFVAAAIAKIDLLPPPPPDLITIFGVVKTIAGDTWTITFFDTSLTVLVDRATVIVGAPVAGDRVEVTGKVDFERRIHAVKITKL